MNQGLSTYSALQIFNEELKNVYKKYYRKKNIFQYLILSLKRGILRLFLISNISLLILVIFELFYQLLTTDKSFYFWKIFLCCNVLLITILNLFLISKSTKAKYTSVFQKFQILINDIQYVMDYNCKGWLNVGNYPFIKIPFASSVNVQWTIRDNQMINLPVALLVKGDLINLRPGQFIFADCEIQCKNEDKNNYEEVYKIGQTFVSKLENEKCQNKQFGDHCSHKVIPMKSCVKAIVTKTPIVGHIDDFFSNHCSKDTEAITVPERYIEYSINVLLLILLVVFVLNAILQIIWIFLIGNEKNLKWSFSITDILLIGLPLQLPLLLLVTLSNIIWKVNCLRYKLDKRAASTPNTASMESIPSSIDLSSSNSGHFGSNGITMDSIGVSSREYLRAHWKQITNQDHQFVRMIYSLGSLTSLCCVDKKGILADPIATPEKIFIYRKRHKHRSSSLINIDRLNRRSNQESSYQTVGSNSNFANLMQFKLRSLVTNDTAISLDLHANMANFNVFEQKSLCNSQFKNEQLIPNLDMNCSMAVPVILDMTRSNTHPFLPSFDDNRWERYISSLKPIGLNILLNNCNPDVTDRYINFADNMSAINFKNLNKSQLIHRCICSLATQIGFKPNSTERFILDSTFAVCRKNDKPVENQTAETNQSYSLPVGNVFSTVVKDSVQGHHQIMSQGSADLLLHMCSDYWDGKDINPLTDFDRSRVLDFYNRNIFSSYCIAFSYSPLFNKMTFDGIQDQFILQILDCQNKNKANTNLKNLQVNKLYSGSLSYNDVFSKGTNLKGIHDSAAELASQALLKSEEVKRLLKHQIFLGLISLQADQVQSDVIDCINRLEQACIRFVFFSTDNQLRSRVFAERLGMESGWNCHISLAEPYENNTKSFPSIRRNSSRYNKPFLLGENSKENIMSKRTCCSEPILHIPAYEVEQITHSTTLNEKNLVLPKCEKEECLFKKEIVLNETSDVTSSSSSGLSSDKRTNSYLENPRDHFPEDKSKLPCGIKSIRPHLEKIDNVPLQVSLFTDCNPEVDHEMMSIMREYGEIICCCGSALTIKNVSLFSSNDCAVAFVPTLHKQCWRQHEGRPVDSFIVKGFQLNKNNKMINEEEPMLRKKTLVLDQTVGFLELSPINIACRLVALPCGLLLNRKAGFNLIVFITECHWLVKDALSCVSFYCLSCIEFVILKFFFNLIILLFDINGFNSNLYMSLNIFPTELQIIYHLYFHAPVLAIVIFSRLAMLGKPLKEPSRKRGRILTYKQCYRFVVASMGRFLPSVLICILILIWNILILNQASQINGLYKNETANTTTNSLRLVPVVISDFIFVQHNIYTIMISFAYMNPEKPFWKFNYLKNFRWLLIASILIGIQFIYFFICWRRQLESYLYIAIWRTLSYPLIASGGGVVIVAISGYVATYWEKKALSVEHRLARLYFGTKLGMYSPV